MNATERNANVAMVMVTPASSVMSRGRSRSRSRSTSTVMKRSLCEKKGKIIATLRNQRNRYEEASRRCAVVMLRSRLRCRQRQRRDGVEEGRCLVSRSVSRSVSRVVLIIASAVGGATDSTETDAVASTDESSSSRVIAYELNELAMVSFWRSVGASESQVQSHVHEARRREKAALAYQSASGASDGEKSGRYVAMNTSMDGTLRNVSCIRERLANLQLILDCEDDVSIAVDAASRKPGIMCLKPTTLATNMYRLKKMLLGVAGGSSTEGRDGNDFVVKMVRKSPSLLERDSASLRKNIRIIEQLVPVDVKRLNEDDEETEEEGENYAVDGPVLVGVESNGERRNEKSGNQRTVLDYIIRIPSLLHYNSGTLLKKKEQLEEFLTEGSLSTQVASNSKKKDNIVAQENITNDSKSLTRTQSVSVINGILRKDVSLLVMDINALKLNFYNLCHSLEISKEDGRAMIRNAPQLLYQDIETVKMRLEELKKMLPGANVEKIIRRQPALLYRDPKTILNKINVLKLQMLPSVSEEKIHKIIEGNPTIIMRNSKQLLRLFRDVKQILNTDSLCEQEELNIEELVSKSPTLLSLKASSLKQKLDNLQSMLIQCSRENGCIGYGGGAEDKEEDERQVVRARDLISIQPTLLGGKHETIRKRLDGLWTYSKRLQKSGYNKWHNQMTSFMLGKSVSSTAALLRLSIKRQDERLGTVCDILEARLVNSEISGSDSGTIEGDYENPRSDFRDIPGISSFMIANQKRFDELCEYLS